MFVLPATTFAWSANSFSSDSEQELLVDTNQARVSAGLPDLPWDTTLGSLARWRSQDMIERDYFDHAIPPTGEFVWDVMDQKGYCYNVAGENIGWNQNWPDDQATAQIMASFMGSPEHRSNILGVAWNPIGIGAYKGRTARSCGPSSSPTTAAAPTPAPTPKPTPKPTAKPTAEPDAAANPGSNAEADAEAHREADRPADAAPDAHPEPRRRDPDAATDRHAAPDPDTDSPPDADTHAHSQPDADPVAVAEPEPVPQSVAQPEPVTEPEPDAQSFTQPVAKSDLLAHPDAERRPAAERQRELRLRARRGDRRSDRRPGRDTAHPARRRYRAAPGPARIDRVGDRPGVRLLIFRIVSPA